MADNLPPAAVERAAAHAIRQALDDVSLTGDAAHRAARAALAAAGPLVTPERDAQVAARALWEAAEAMENEADHPGNDDELWTPSLIGYYGETNWLRARAGRIERQEES